MTTDRAIRVVVVDDHPMFRAGLRTLVEETATLELVGSADNGDDGVSLAVEEQADVVLMDIRMPRTSGVEATKRLLALRPEIGVLMLTMLEDDTSVLAALRAGARGYVLKGAASEDIVRAVTAVAAGELIVGADVARRMSQALGNSRIAPSHPFPELTVRESDVLNLVAAGLANGEIARRLGLSIKTVQNNISNIFAKLLVADRAAAIVKAREAGLGDVSR